MKGIAKLKEQARLHEQKEEWDKAVQAYEKALSLAGDGEVDLALLNRVGDLYLRLRRQHEAVRCYEEAADRYAEAGFYNNAIALCNKALRYAPDRAELFRKLGRFSGAQGFVTDARRYFLEYAARMQKAGQMRPALAALEEFADLAEDAEIREQLAQTLVAHGETAEAVSQLRRALELRTSAGDAEAAAALRARILELDPGADLSTPPPRAAAGDRPAARAAAHSDLLPGLELQTAADSAGFGSVDPAPGGAMAAIGKPPAPGAPGRDEDVVGAADLPMLDEPSPWPAAAEASPAAGPPDGPATSAPGLIDLDRVSLSLTPAEKPAPAPRAGGAAAARREPPEEPGSLERGVAPGASDGALDAALSRAREEAAAGRYTEAVNDLDALLDRMSAGSDRLEQALAILDELVARSPDRAAAHQLRAEYAARTGDRTRIVDAYLDLGEYLNRSGDTAKAAFVFERVLDLDGSSERARAGLARSRGGAASAGDGDYVDLAALIAEDLRAEAAGDRSGSPGGAAAEAEDFEDLLSRFRAKATEDVEERDPSSHYDLGLAFREMGLIDEAIAEFQKALSGGAEQLKIYEELGKCFMEKQEYGLAAKILGRALHMPRSSDRELLGVYYLLGVCYVEVGRRNEARSAFERVLELGGDFADVRERLARL